MALLTLTSVIASQFSFVFHDLDTFEAYWLCYFVCYPSVGFSAFLIGLKLCIVGQKITRVCSSQPIIPRGYVMLTHLITANVNFDLLVRVVSTRTLHYKITTFLFVISIL